MTRTRIRPRAGLELDQTRITNQSDTAGTDINKIVAQYRATGTMPNVALRNPLYGDFSGPQTIHEQREAVFEAEERFMQLPAETRSYCNNDWVEFLNKMEDPSEHKGLEEHGLHIFETLPTSTTEPPENPSPPPTTPEPTPGTTPE